MKNILERLSWTPKNRIKQTDTIKPMKTIMVGKRLPFNEMAAKQNIGMYIVKNKE